MSENDAQYRIRGTGGGFLIALAILLDLLPIIAIVGGAALVVTQISGSWCAGAAKEGGESTVQNAKCGLAVALGAATVVSMIAIAPLLYFLVSLLVYVFALLFFPIWFFFAHRYYLFGLGGKKITTNAVMLMLELLPILNAIIPGWTLWVIGHIRISRAEDREKKKKSAPVTAPEEMNPVAEIPRVSPA